MFEYVASIVEILRKYCMGKELIAREQYFQTESQHLFAY